MISSASSAATEIDMGVKSVPPTDDSPLDPTAEAFFADAAFAAAPLVVTGFIPNRVGAPRFFKEGRREPTGAGLSISTSTTSSSEALGFPKLVRLTALLTLLGRDGGTLPGRDARGMAYSLSTPSVSNAGPVQQRDPSFVSIRVIRGSSFPRALDTQPSTLQTPRLWKHSSAL